MNKRQLIRKAATSSCVSQDVLRKCLDILLNTMTDELNNGNFITLSNFGTFKVKEQTQRSVRNPKSGEKKLIEPGIKISFKTSPGIYRENK